MLEYPALPREKNRKKKGVNCGAEYISHLYITFNLNIFHISLSLPVFVMSAHEAVTEVVVVISKQVLLLPADKAQSLCLNLAVDIEQKLLKELSLMQYVVAVVLQLCEF